MLSVSNLVKTYGATSALDHLDLELGIGEVLSILGPSGCGKSTLLRVIAGLETADTGTITWDDRDVRSVPVHERGFGLMFQDLALFPHRSVGDNVAFGLRMANWSRSEINDRVAEVLEWVGLAGFDHRNIEGLSGGEAQRVALARTLAPRPRLVMLDEPLGALDRLLRERLVGDIRQILEAADTPALYVTHDHGEARAVADRIAIMRAGRVVQTGTFDEIRHRPADEWVTSFVGG